MKESTILVVQKYAFAVHGGPEAAAAAGCVVPPPQEMPEHRDFKLFNTYCEQLRVLLAADGIDKVWLAPASCAMVCSADPNF